MAFLLLVSAIFFWRIDPTEPLIRTAAETT
jgi:hypothetical protein